MKHFIPSWEKFLSQGSIYFIETKNIAWLAFESLKLNTNKQESHIREMFIA